LNSITVVLNCKSRSNLRDFGEAAPALALNRIKANVMVMVINPQQLSSIQRNAVIGNNEIVARGAGK